MSVLTDFAEGLQGLGTQLASAGIPHCVEMSNVGE